MDWLDIYRHIKLKIIKDTKSINTVYIYWLRYGKTTVAKTLIPGATLLSNIVPEETNVQQLNKSYFNVNEGSQRIAGNPATDLYAGMNRTSDFGNLEKAGNKRLATRQKTIERKGYKAGDKFFDDTQKMKEDALIKNFYKDAEDEKQELDSSKSDNELNNNEIGYEKSDIDNNDSYTNDDDKK